ncbi:MAG: hypothetical protein H0W33_00180 [Gammaproteobacteria bacterium]|nr:hypothetical protein [Gammaproteobacteria bacterium]
MLTQPPQVNAAITGRQLAIRTFQLVVLVYLVRYFEIGSPQFGTIMLLAVPAFLINALLPFRYRLEWFLTVSLIGIVLVLGPVSAIWLIAIVTAFIAICHLPVPLGSRITILLAAGAALFFFRLRGWGVPWSETAWPIIASILMFRVIVYLYDLHHEKTRPSARWSLSYFFLLPNVCFPLFPVVDFKKFRQTYYSEPAPVVYGRGMSWIFRGVYQLILYRIVYQFVVIPPEEVFNAAQLLHFIVSSYLLYLRVSGLFHLIVGVLLLFGFNLPETHKKYYLASSFNDFWRRINIYWKDFMMKIFYYPIYFKVKGLGATPALIIATVAVFFATWLLHAYQWFWLRGTFLFELHDLLFWSVLGVLVVLNSLREIKYGRVRSIGRQPLLSSGRLSNVCRVASTFLTISILWSMWSSDSLEQWLLMWKSAGGQAVLIVIAVLVFYALANWGDKRSEKVSTKVRTLVGRDVAAAEPGGIRLGSGLIAGSLVVLVFMSRPEIPWVPDAYADIARQLRTVQLNRRDQARMERGYYEHLLNVNRHSEGLWTAVEKKPADWIDNLNDTEIAVRVPRFLITELASDKEIQFKGAQLKTNRWGMRDRDYPIAKSKDSTRVALFGTSHTLGSGVSNAQVFEHLLEQRLNAGAAGATPSSAYEILNFSMVAYSALQHLYLLDHKVREFRPDAIVYFALEDDERFILRHLSLAIRNGIEIPYQPVLAIVNLLGLDASHSDEEIRRKLAPYAAGIQAWAERELAANIRGMGATALCVFLPKVQSRPDQATAETRQRIAREAGFHTLDLHDVYDGYSRQELQIKPWDDHPNELAHSLIAERLHQELVDRPQLLGKSSSRIAR